MGDKFTRRDFLYALFEGYFKTKSGFILVRTSKLDAVKAGTRFFPSTHPLSREQYSEDQHVLFGVCPRERMKPEKEYIKHITALWASIDIGPDGYSGKERHFLNDRQAHMAVREFPLAPSIIVKSGRGMQLYWLLTDVEDVTETQRVEDLLRRISDYFQCASPAGVDAALRLPGTWNAKAVGQSLACEVEHLDPGTRYDLGEFEGLDLRIILPSKRPPKMFIPPLVVPGRVRVVDHAPGRGEPLTGEPAGTPSVAGQAREERETGGRSKPVLMEPIPPEADLGTVPPGLLLADKLGLSRPSTPVPASPHGLLGNLDEEDMDRLLDRFLDKFSEKLLERLTDRIVEKLLERLGHGTR
jgi:hypothetical protein